MTAPIPTFSAYSETWRDQVLALKTEGSQHTCLSHLRALNKAFGDVRLNKLDNPTMRQAFGDLAKRLAPKSVANVWATCHSVLEYARRDGHLKEIPEPVLPKVRRQEQPWFELASMRILIGAAPATLGPLCYLLAETGLRIGEALALRGSDIDLERHALRVERKVYRGVIGELKTESSRRELSVSGRLIDLVRKMDTRDVAQPGSASALGAGGCQDSNLGPPDQYLWRTAAGTPLWPDVIAAELEAVAKSAGVKVLGASEDSPAWAGFHAFRRSNANLMAQIGVPEPIADLRQGHSTARGLTYGLYAQRQALQDREWAEKIAEKLAVA